MLQNRESKQTHTIDYKDLRDIGPDWIKYEGSFLEDAKHGIGKLFLANGDKFFGSFEKDKING